PGGCGRRARSSLLRRAFRHGSSVVAALAALAPRLVRLAHHGYPDRLLVRPPNGPGGDEGRRSGGGRAPPARDRAPQPSLLRARRPGYLRRRVRRALPPPTGARGGTPRAAHARFADPARGRRAGDRVRDCPPPPADALAAERGDRRGDGRLRRAGAEVP